MRKSTLIALPVIAVAFAASAASCDVANNAATTTSDGKQTISVITDAPTTATKPAAPKFTRAQQEAIDSAKDYLSTSAFSKAGLIQQLSSKAGDGFPLKVARFAVNHLNVDWNHEAVLSAKDYLSMSSFSLSGLIEQLESPSGDGYTHAQAVYGAKQAYKSK